MPNPLPNHEFRSEPLEPRSLFSASLDLSMQAAIWTGGEVFAPAPAVTFRIDATRSGPFGSVGPVSGATPIPPFRIDGPPDGLATAAPVPFRQIVDADGILLAAPSFDIPAGGIDRGVAAPLAPFEKPDWTGFEIFKDVSFTFIGGEIRAGLPIDGKTVPVSIAINELPPGAEPPKGAVGGVGNFYARLGAFGEVVFPPPPGSDPLAIPPTSPPATPPSPPATTPDSPATPPGNSSPGKPTGSPTPDRPAGRPALTERPEQAVAVESSALPAHARSDGQMTFVYPDRGAGSIAAGRGLTAVATVASGGGQLANPQRPTTLLMETPADADRAREMGQYLMLVAGTQLTALQQAALRLFGGQPTPDGAANGLSLGDLSLGDLSLGDLSLGGPAIIDLDALRNSAGSAVALGLSPWYVAATPSPAIATAWKITAGVSLVVAVGGYMYCKEYTARRRQEQLQASRFIAGRRQPAIPAARPRPSRNLIGYISRIWRDEVTY